MTHQIPLANLSLELICIDAMNALLYDIQGNWDLP